MKYLIVIDSIERYMRMGGVREVQESQVLQYGSIGSIESTPNAPPARKRKMAKNEREEKEQREGSEKWVLRAGWSGSGSMVEGRVERRRRRAKESQARPGTR